MLSGWSFADPLLENKPSTLNECAHTTRVSNTDIDPINSRKKKSVSTNWSIKEVIKHNIQFPCVSAVCGFIPTEDRQKEIKWGTNFDRPVRYDRVRSAPDKMTVQCCADNNNGCYHKGKINLSEQLRIFGMRPVVPEAQEFHVNGFTSVWF
jgi:hypothetical protein